MEDNTMEPDAQQNKLGHWVSQNNTHPQGVRGTGTYGGQYLERPQTVKLAP